MDTQFTENWSPRVLEVPYKAQNQFTYKEKKIINIILPHSLVMVINKFKY